MSDNKDPPQVKRAKHLLKLLQASIRNIENGAPVGPTMSTIAEYLSELNCIIEGSGTSVKQKKLLDEVASSVIGIVVKTLIELFVDSTLSCNTHAQALEYISCRSHLVRQSRGCEWRAAFLNAA